MDRLKLLEMILTISLAQCVCPYLRIGNIQEYRDSFQRKNYILEQLIEVWGLMQIDDSVIFSHTNNDVAAVKFTLFLHPCPRPFRDLFLLALLVIRFRSYISPLSLSVNNAEQYNLLNCFLTTMPVCLLETCSATTDRN